MDHPNICNIHEIDETPEGQPFIVMACYVGETRKDKIAAAGSAGESPMPISNAVDIAIQNADGLTKAHEQGIIHRDIKLANTPITTDGTVKILDFGLAKFQGQAHLTQTGSTIGTAAYILPEQTCGENVDQRTDNWTFACGMIPRQMSLCAII